MRIHAAALLLLATAMNAFSEPHHPISRAHAEQIARNYVAGISKEHDFVIMDDRTVEKPFGWVFFYTTRRYLQTRDPNDLVPDSAPLVVLRADGSLDHLSTSVPPARAIEVYEKYWREKQAAGK